MSLSEEISKLAALKNQGALTEEEFELAKKKLLAEDSPKRAVPRNAPPRRRYTPPLRRKDSMGEAANRYVSFHIISSVIGLILFLLFAGPMMCSGGLGGPGPF